MASIWHNDEQPGYDKGKAHTSFSKWRVLVMDRTAELIGGNWMQARDRMHLYGLNQLGIDYDDNLTAEDLAQKLAQ